MYAIYEDYRIILIKSPFKPFSYLCADALDHPADTRFEIVLPVNLLKHVSSLLLRKPFSVKGAGQSVALFFLVAQNGKYLWVEVAMAVSGNAKLKHFPLSVSASGPISITLITRIFSEKLVAFSQHHTLDHHFH